MEKNFYDSQTLSEDVQELKDALLFPLPSDSSTDDELMPFRLCGSNLLCSKTCTLPPFLTSLPLTLILTSVELDQILGDALRVRDKTSFLSYPRR